MLFEISKSITKLVISRRIILHFKFFSSLVAITFLPVAAYAATSSYNCKFTLEANPKGVSAPTSSFDLRYIVDIDAKKAYLIGNAGSSEVEIIPNVDGISFVEITNTGNVMVTAIANAGDAVHSRNGIMFKTLVPSQYYGKCIRL